MSQPHETAAPPSISATNVSKHVPIENRTLALLEDINLSVNTGESLAIVGTSGSGKSTLLGLLAGLDQASSGTIVLAGQNISTMNEDQRAQVRSESVGFVFQSFQLLPNLTALENVMLPLEVRNDSAAEPPAREMLNQVGLGDRLNHYPRQLSGGEQQRVALARAFVTRPAILFADEPTGNLDQDTGRHIESLLFELNQQNQTTLVMVTHDLRLANECDRTLRLEAGRIKES